MPITILTMKGLFGKLGVTLYRFKDPGNLDKQGAGTLHGLIEPCPSRVIVVKHDVSHAGIEDIRGHLGAIKLAEWFGDLQAAGKRPR